MKHILPIFMLSIAALLSAAPAGAAPSRDPGGATQTREPTSVTPTRQPNAMAPSNQGEDRSLLKANCYCKITYTSFGDTSPGSISGSNLLGDEGILTTFGGLNAQSQANKHTCRDLCSQKCAQDPNFNNPAFWLNRLGPAACGKTIACYSAVGTGYYDRAQTPTNQNLASGLRCCSSPAQINCAPGAVADTNGPPPKICKRVWCTGPAATQPPNDTSIDGWGFTWANSVIRWEAPASYVPAQTYVAGDPRCTPPLHH